MKTLTLILLLFAPLFGAEMSTTLVMPDALQGVWQVEMEALMDEELKECQKYNFVRSSAITLTQIGNGLKLTFKKGTYLDGSETEIEAGMVGQKFFMEFEGREHLFWTIKQHNSGYYFVICEELSADKETSKQLYMGVFKVVK